MGSPGGCDPRPARNPSPRGRTAAPALPVIDVHIHMASISEPGCVVSRALQRQPAFASMLLADGVRRAELRRDFDGTIRDHVLGTLERATTVDRGVLLALDAIYDENGHRQEEASHLVVSNAYVARLARTHPKVLFGASVHPNRGPLDGRAELERWLGGDPPAALLKWLPNAQLIDPADPRHDWFYETLAKSGVPLLCHTGPENAVPVPHPVDTHQRLGDPKRLRRALDIGVTVLAAHSAMRLLPFQDDYLGDLAALMREAERNGRWHLFADVSAMCLPCRIGTVGRVLESIPGERMILGSDYPVPVSDMPLNVMKDLAFGDYVALLATENPLDKNFRQLLAMGFPASIGTRAAQVIPARALAAAKPAGVSPPSGTMLR
jgi:predicted TIM-barrel fold metal-dependent hydrolase